MYECWRDRWTAGLVLTDDMNASWYWRCEGAFKALTRTAEAIGIRIHIEIQQR